MHNRRNAAARRAQHISVYRGTRALFLAMALLLPWQGMAQADDYVPPATSQLPDSAQGPGADRIPPGLACTDDMDFSPEYNQPSPFDADSVAYRPRQDRALAMPVAQDDRCENPRQKIDLV